MNSSSKRRVKIVGTLGPSSRELSILTDLARAGLDVARLNFSHGTHDVHRATFEAVREAARKIGRNIGVLQDLQGPKIRAGVLPKEGIELKPGDVLLLHAEGKDPALSTQGRKAIPISAEIAEPIARTVSTRAPILFDDGKIVTHVVEARNGNIVVEVQHGGRLTSNKGMNLPGTPLPIPSVTEKDLEDLKFGLSLGADLVALSFVRSPKDLIDIRERIRKTSNHEPFLVAKIEREEAIQDMNAVIDASDGIMVARGDMAVEIGAERVPIVQKQLIRACNEVGVPVITATQMLESMIQSASPTRAEASDVANAVFDGTDAVMLSAETASGQYPVVTVQTMAKIVAEAEQFKEQMTARPELIPATGSIVESIEFSAGRIAEHIGAVAVACITHTGVAARSLAKFRPTIPIVAIMDRPEALRKLAVVWGVEGVLIPDIVATDDLFTMVDEALTQNGIARTGDHVVVTAGLPTLRRGTTNMVKVHKVGALEERIFRR